MENRDPNLTTQTSIRNLAVIAHVDHGKTTLVDRLLQATGAVPAHQQLGERILDTNPLERERGITIFAKNISLYYRDVKINLIDTPGHADFGGEVERVLRMADGVLLLVDAAEGPMPQTRFVLRKAFERRLRPLVVINKVDRPDARPLEVYEEVGELFLELLDELGLDSRADFGGADLLDFPVVYASAKEGYALAEAGELDLPPENRKSRGVTALLDAILAHLPPPTADLEGPLQMQIASLDYSDYVGRIGIGRIYRGRLEAGDRVVLLRGGNLGERTVRELYLFDKLGRVRTAAVGAGDICAVTGIDDVQIGDTIASPDHPEGLPVIEVDRPTISMVFQVNDSPFAGREGRFVTSRHLRERLLKEVESNVALRVRELEEAGSFEVSGRGTLHLGILIENLRREGYEFQVGKPRPIFREEGGVRLEPIELLVCQTPEEAAGKVIEVLGARRGELVKYEPSGERVHLEIKVPARGLIGMGSRLLTITGGEAVIYHSFLGYEPYKGPIPRRANGVMVASRTGTAVPYALWSLRDRGPMFIAPGEAVYEGMIVGEHVKEDDITVNVCREKKLTNIRAAGSDENVILSPPRRMSIEEALEYIDDDELLEVTPKAIRLRKRALNAKERRREARAAAGEGD